MRTFLALLFLCLGLSASAQNQTPIYNLARTNTVRETNWIAIVSHPNATNGTRRIQVVDLVSSMQGFSNWTTVAVTNAQPPSTVLTNLSGTGALTNLFVAVDPTDGSQFAIVFGNTNGSGRAYPLIKGTNVVIYTNSQGIVINAQPAGLTTVLSVSNTVSFPLAFEGTNSLGRLLSLEAGTNFVIYARGSSNLVLNGMPSGTGGGGASTNANQFGAAGSTLTLASGLKTTNQVNFGGFTNNGAFTNSDEVLIGNHLYVGGSVNMEGGGIANDTFTMNSALNLATKNTNQLLYSDSARDVQTGDMGQMGAYDFDSWSYFNRAGITNLQAKTKVDGFVKSMKAVNLWTSIVDAVTFYADQQYPTNGSNFISIRGRLSNLLTNRPVLTRHGLSVASSVAIAGFSMPDTRTGTVAVVVRNATNTPPFGRVVALNSSFGAGHEISIYYDGGVFDGINWSGGFAQGLVKWNNGLGPSGQTASFIPTDGTQGAFEYDPTRHTLFLTSDNNHTSKSYVDSVLTETVADATIISNVLNRLTIGTFGGFGSYDPALPTFSVGCMVLLNRVISDAEAKELEMCMTWLEPATEHWVFEGDSLLYNNFNLWSNDVPHQLHRMAGISNNVVIHTVANSGQALSTIVSQTNEWMRYAPGKYGIDRTRFFLGAGVNDLLLNSDAGTNIFSNTVFLASIASRLGMETIVMTPPQSLVYTNNQPIQWTNTINLIMSNASLFNYVFPRHMVHAKTNANYYNHLDPVGVHYNAAEYRKEAEELVQMLYGGQRQYQTLHLDSKTPSPNLVFGTLWADYDTYNPTSGVVKFFDGSITANLVGVTASDTPLNGQTLKWNSATGKYTHEDDNTGAAGAVIQVQTNSVVVGNQTNLNLIAGSNISLLATNVPGSGKVDVQINSTGGGGSSVGADGQVQYASNALFQSSAKFTYSPITETLFLDVSGNKPGLLIDDNGSTFGVYLTSRAIQATNGALTMQAGNSAAAMATNAFSISSTTGAVTPATDARQNFGSSSAYWNGGFFASLFPSNFTKQSGGTFEMPEETAPGTPASGLGRLYAKSDGKLYWKDDGGTETDLTLGASVNGEAAVTNATRIGLVNGKSGITNLLRSLEGGFGISLTNRGTNIDIAITDAELIEFAGVSTNKVAFTNSIVVTNGTGGITVSRAIGSDGVVRYQVNDDDVGSGGTNFAGIVVTNTIGSPIMMIDTVTNIVIDGKTNHYVCRPTNTFTMTAQNLPTTSVGMAWDIDVYIAVTNMTLGNPAFFTNRLDQLPPVVLSAPSTNRYTIRWNGTNMLWIDDWQQLTTGTGPTALQTNAILSKVAITNATADRVAVFAATTSQLTNDTITITQLRFLGNIGDGSRLTNFAGTVSAAGLGVLTNIATTGAITNLNDNQFAAESTIASIKDGALITNNYHHGTLIVSNSSGSGGSGFGAVRLASTNNTGYTELAHTNAVTGTNRLVFSLGTSTPAAAQVLKLHSSTISAGVNTIIITNDTDSVGAGAENTATNANQFGAAGATLTIKDTAMLTNVQHYGRLDITNGPGAVGSIRFLPTNGQAFTEITTTNAGAGTNTLVLSLGATTLAAGQPLRLHSATASSGTMVAVVTNDLVQNYDTIYVDAAAMVSNITAGATFTTVEEGASPTTNKMSDGYTFSGTTSNYVGFKLAMPLDWDLGTVRVKLWTQSTNNLSTTTNVWCVQAVALKNADVLTNSTVVWGTAAMCSNNVSSAGSQVLLTPATETLTVANTPAAAGQLVYWRVWRNTGHGLDRDSQGADAGQVKLLGAWIQYGRTATKVASW